MSETKIGALVGGRFVLEHELGRGGASTVWRARDLSNGAPVALKMLHVDLRLLPGPRNRFTKEARLLAELDHPGLVRTLAWNLDDPQPHIAMEYLDGRVLDQILRLQVQDRRYLSPRDLKRWLADLFDAVEHAHERGVVHRDLKPSNILIIERDLESSVRVLDFGVARLLGDSDGTTIGRMVGTYAYMSPEQAAGERVDQRSDVFSLGVLTYELLTLKRAWETRVISEVLERIKSGPRPRPTSERPDLPVELDEVLASAMAIDPAQRPATAKALWLGLERLIEALPEPTAPMRAPPDPEAERSVLVVTPSELGTDTTAPIRGGSVEAPPKKDMRMSAPQAIALAAVAISLGALLAMWTRNEPPPRSTVEVIAPHPDPIATPRPTPPPPIAPPIAPPSPPIERAPAKVAKKPAPPPAKIAPPRDGGGGAHPDKKGGPPSEERRLLARAEAAPNDTEAFRTLITALRRRIESVPNGSERARLDRLLEIAALSSDLNAAARVLADLERR